MSKRYMKIISRHEAIAQGLTAFFTGEPCKHGHIAERSVARYTCAECNRVRANRYYESNAPAVLAKKDKERVREYNAKYQAANKERCAAERAAYREKNKEKLAQQSAAYRVQNKEKIKARRALSKKQNKGSVNEANMRRRVARLKRTPSWLTEDDLWIIKEIHELAVLRSSTTGVNWHVDHIIPLRGKTVSGLHVPLNLQVITQEENLRKLNSWDPDNG